MKIFEKPLSPEDKQTIHAIFENHAFCKVNAHEMGKERLLVLEEAETVHGYLTFRSFWGVLHLKNLAVHESHRGKGIGHALMTSFITLAKQEGFSKIQVETFSFQAPDFYKKFGFETDFIRQGYSHGLSFHYMTLTLPK